MGQQLMRSDTKCIGCGVCVESCSKGAIKAFDIGFSIDRSLCDDCLECVSVCAAEALSPVGEWQSVEDVMAVVLRDQGFYNKSGGGLTISGGELLSQWQFADALVDAAVSENVSVALDTSGCGSGDALFKMAGKADHILFDMKCIIDEGHKEYMGLGNEQILKNLEQLASDPDINKKINIRMPLVKDVNDTEAVIDKTRDFFKEQGLTFVHPSALP